MSGLIIDQKERVTEWVSKRLGRVVPYVGHIAIGYEIDGVLVAGIVIDNYNAQNCYPHIAIDKTGKHVIELLRACTDYAFRQCKLKRMTAAISSTKPKIIEFDKKIGFVEEFIMKDGDDYGDLVFLVLYPENFRWRVNNE